MLKLKHENFIKARDYIFAHGDNINCAWFRYLFENNDTNEFLNVLSKYQQEDGGFGGIYYEFDPSADHPLIQKMMKYILGLYMPEIGNWGEVVVPEEYRMNQQSQDGKWPLGWSFGSDEELQKLQAKYETYCTLVMLEELDRFDMIER